MCSAPPNKRVLRKCGLFYALLRMTSNKIWMKVQPYVPITDWPFDTYPEWVYHRKRYNYTKCNNDHHDKWAVWSYMNCSQYFDKHFSDLDGYNFSFVFRKLCNRCGRPVYCPKCNSFLLEKYAKCGTFDQVLERYNDMRGRTRQFIKCCMRSCDDCNPYYHDRD